MMKIQKETSLLFSMSLSGGLIYFALSGYFKSDFNLNNVLQFSAAFMAMKLFNNVIEGALSWVLIKIVAALLWIVIFAILYAKFGGQIDVFWLSLAVGLTISFYNYLKEFISYFLKRKEKDN